MLKAILNPVVPAYTGIYINTYSKKTLTTKQFYEKIDDQFHDAVANCRWVENNPQGLLNLKEVAYDYRIVGVIAKALQIKIKNNYKLDGFSFPTYKKDYDKWQSKQIEKLNKLKNAIFSKMPIIEETIKSNLTQELQKKLQVKRGMAEGFVNGFFNFVSGQKLQRTDEICQSVIIQQELQKYPLGIYEVACNPSLVENISVKIIESIEFKQFFTKNALKIAYLNKLCLFGTDSHNSLASFNTDKEKIIKTGMDTTNENMQIKFFEFANHQLVAISRDKSLNIGVYKSDLSCKYLDIIALGLDLDVITAVDIQSDGKCAYFCIGFKNGNVQIFMMTLDQSSEETAFICNPLVKYDTGKTGINSIAVSQNLVSSLDNVNTNNTSVIKQIVIYVGTKNFIKKIENGELKNCTNLRMMHNTNLLSVGDNFCAAANGDHYLQIFRKSDNEAVNINLKNEKESFRVYAGKIVALHFKGDTLIIVYSDKIIFKHLDKKLDSIVATGPVVYKIEENTEIKGAGFDKRSIVLFTMHKSTFVCSARVLTLSDNYDYNVSI